jgi:hypothetical protein
MFSHMMIFCFFVLFSFVHFLCDGRIMREKRLLLLSIPYILLLSLLVMFSQIEHPLAPFTSSPSEWYSIERRLLTLPLDSFTRGRNSSTIPLIDFFASLVFLFASIAVPFILGYRLSKKLTSYALMITFLCAWLFLPNVSRFVFVIQERFVLFFIPAYILCFTRGNMPLHSVSRLGATFFIVLIVSLMYHPLRDLYLFKSEAASFSSLLQDLPESKRALMVVRARESKHVKVPFVYIHFPLWYQALKGGWVEYNTAWAYVAPVRYLPDKVPEVQIWDDWALDLGKLRHCEIYDLIFVRIYDELNDDAFSETPCQGYRILARRDEWYVFQKIPGAPAQ